MTKNYDYYMQVKKVKEQNTRNVINAHNAVTTALPLFRAEILEALSFSRFKKDGTLYKADKDVINEICVKHTKKKEDGLKVTFRAFSTGHSIFSGKYENFIIKIETNYYEDVVTLKHGTERNTRTYRFEDSIFDTVKLEPKEVFRKLKLKSFDEVMKAKQQYDILEKEFEELKSKMYALKREFDTFV